MTHRPLRRSASRLGGAAACGLLLGGCAALAPTAPRVDPATAEAIEATRSSVRQSAIWVARGVDSWFGDRPFKDGGSVHDGRLTLDLRHRQDDGFSADLRFNARFRLPNLEALGYLFVGRDNPRDVISDQPGAFTSTRRLAPGPAEDLSFFAGFGREISDAVDFRLGFRGGLKPYAQARYRHPWQFGPDDRVEFRQTVFWSSDDRLGATAAVSVEHAWSPLLVARWLSAATVTQEQPDLGWQTRAGVHRGFGQERWLSVEALASGRRNTGVDVRDYGLQLGWEQPVYKDTLVGELIVGHFWPRPDAALPRGRAWAVGLGLKLHF
jgi:hypothetical protein